MCNVHVTLKINTKFSKWPATTKMLSTPGLGGDLEESSAILTGILDGLAQQGEEGGVVMFCGP